MTVPAEATRAMQDALARADRERRRADRSAGIAQRHERQVFAEPHMQTLHARMASMHRRAQRLHLAAAAMHVAHADRLKTWADGSRRHKALPGLMVGVAETAGADSATVAVFGPGLVETLTIASDDTAKAAQDAEFALGEGPAREAATGDRAVRAAGDALRRRWPAYGSAVGGLGIHSVAAVPILPVRGTPIGALTLFGLAPNRTIGDLDSLHMIADIVAYMLLSDNDTKSTPGSFPFADGDHRAIIHQAAGLVSVQNGCAIPDALALIRARAFADERPLESIAADILDQRLRLP
ncbi:GAF and ANTAR domain-containing protein [Asanoa iriomotensis]|nr:GAF and ANTAR domain-containing protein [Asanoa iriomotensis]